MAGNVLIIGSGGREHALAWKIAQSPDSGIVYVAPGNAGTNDGKCRNIPVDFGKVDNFLALRSFIDENKIGIVVPGPEAPLYNGIVDSLNFQGYNRVFGPTKSPSALEADKLFSFRFMRDAGIPQANGMECHTLSEMQGAIGEIGGLGGVVAKAGGLTGGKGVTVYDSIEEAERDSENFFKLYEKCKDGGGEGVLVSERLYGQEFSVYSFCDGKRALTLDFVVQDHKARDDNDLGPNTGGMGAYSPVPFVSTDVLKWIDKNVMNRVVQKMAERGTPYHGFLYAGMIMTGEGPKVLEFNVRMGDPETQPAMMKMKSDLYHIISAGLDGKLEDVRLENNPGAVCGVVLASKGYPGSYEKGLVIRGLDVAGGMPGIKIFHAGTELKLHYKQMIGSFESEVNRIVTSGGRVLLVAAESENGLSHAQARAYRAVEKIYFEDKEGNRVEPQYRRDIGAKGLIAA